MRLWHQSLIPYLDRQHLLGQHRECCALRGKGWGRKHATVDYVFTHDRHLLYFYHMKVMEEMKNRGYNADKEWLNYSYHGKILGNNPFMLQWDDASLDSFTKHRFPYYIYPEHDQAYLIECINLLKEKRAPMDFEKIERDLL